MQRLTIGLVALLCVFVGTAFGQEKDPAKVLRCDRPEAYEKVCYNDAECIDYLRGYSAVITMKMYNYKGWYPDVVYTFNLNLFEEHRGLYLIVRTDAERQQEEMHYLKQWTIICDLEGNIIHKQFNEGYRKTGDLNLEEKRELYK